MAASKPEDTAEPVSPGTVVAGRYRVERQLGVGGMGAVYLVQHVHTDERFAMKVLLDTVIQDAGALERFRREAKAPARIDSDHVVRVTDADVAPELDGAPFLVMEYLRGEELEQYLEKTGALPPRDVFNFLRQISRALDKAHAIGIVHRDLKPENIFLTRRDDGTPFVKVLDFGIAKYTKNAPQELSAKATTSPGEIFGTPLFMSPEQAKSEGDAISPQTDIWALGLIAHKMLTAEDFWRSETLTALIAEIVYEPMKKPSARGADFGPAYDDWFLKCCDREPSKRFESAGAAVVALGQALRLGDLSIPDAPLSLRPPRESFGQTANVRPLSKTDLQLATTDVPRSRPPAGKSTLTAALVGVGVLAAAAGAFWFIQNGKLSGSPTNGSATVESPVRANGAGDAPTGEVTTRPAAPSATAIPTIILAEQEVSNEPAKSAEPIPSAAPSAKPAWNGRPRPLPVTSSAPTIKPNPVPQDPLGSRD